MDEFKLLIHILEFCEGSGNRASNFHFDVDHELVEKLYERYGVQPSIDELKTIVDRCYARQWLDRTCMGSSRHSGFKLTSKGMGIANSKRKSQQRRQSRPLVKKVSDYMEDHKGLFILAGFLITLASLIISYLTKGFGNG